MAADRTGMLNVTELDGEGGSNLVTRYCAFSSAKACPLSKDKFVKVKATRIAGEGLEPSTPAL
ncbi:MAG: hypothetical protein M3Y64_11035 [Gemmatimonadota bacterium]|nr:hypothetical protein [Gemmatimonadota bacterium]